jgi:hypothetical protein
MVRSTAIVSLLVAAAVGVPAGSASAKPIGGCPTEGGFTLTSVAGLGIDEETAAGIPSLDGNRDGFTCIKLLDLPSNSAIFGAFTFRDNTVR